MGQLMNVAAVKSRRRETEPSIQLHVYTIHRENNCLYVRKCSERRFLKADDLSRIKALAPIGKLFKNLDSSFSSASPSRDTVV